MNYGPLKPPSAQALEVFAKVLENNPDADMRAIPNEWLLKERGISAEFSERISTLESKLEDDRKYIVDLEALRDSLESRLDSFTAEALRAQTEWHERNKALESRLEWCEKRFELGRGAWDTLARHVAGLNSHPGAEDMLTALSGVKLLPPTAEDMEAIRRDLIQAGIVEKHAHLTEDVQRYGREAPPPFDLPTVYDKERQRRICEECEHPVDSEPHLQHCPEAIRG